MIEALFLATWSLVFFAAMGLILKRTSFRYRVHCIIVLNCVFLCGVFAILPLIAGG